MKEMDEIEMTWGPMIIDSDELEIDIETNEIDIEINVVVKDSEEESMVGEVSLDKDPTPMVGCIHCPLAQLSLPKMVWSWTGWRVVTLQET